MLFMKRFKKGVDEGVSIEVSERMQNCLNSLGIDLTVCFYVRNAVLQPDGSMASMSVGGYWTREHAERIEDMRSARVQNCEMEAGVLLTLANLFGVRAGRSTPEGRRARGAP